MTDDCTAKKSTDSEKGTTVEPMDAATLKAQQKKIKGLEALKTRRFVAMDQIERVRLFSVQAKEKSATTSVPDLQVRIEALESAFSNFKVAQMKIEEVDNEEINNPERSHNEEVYYSTIATLKVLLNTKQANKDETLDVSQSISNKHDSIKLPVIELPSFSGDVTKWTVWYNRFVSLVHNNPKLSKQARFHYLLSKLSETAIAPVEGLKIEDDNYDVALARLKERFENKKIIAQEHLQRIFNHPKIHKASAPDLRNLVDKISNHLTGLSNLKRPVEHWDDVVVFIMTSKLDPATLSKWNDDAPTDRLPSLKELSDFLKKRAQHLEGNVTNQLFTLDSSIKSDNQKGQKSSSKHCVKAFITTKNTCIFCSVPGHFIYRCYKFQNLSIPERIHKIKNMNLCYNCLKSSDHSSANCPSSGCRHCGKKHHTLLDLVENATSFVPQAPLSSSSHPVASENLTASKEMPASTSHLMYSSSTENSILGTAVINIINKLQHIVPCRVLLDSGSQTHLISERLMQCLGTQRLPSHTTLSCANNVVTIAKHKTILNIGSRINGFTATIEALVIPQITGLLPDKKIDIKGWNIPNNINLSDPHFNVPQRIDLLLGVDLFYTLLCVGQIKLGSNLPALQNTLFGWVVAGQLPKSNNPSTSNRRSFAIRNTPHESESDGTLNNTLKAFWEIESFSSQTDVMSAEEKECENHFVKHYSRLESGRFSVKLPFKQNPRLLGNSYDIAKRRLLSLERRFLKNPDLFQQYSAFMNEMLLNSHMELVNKVDLTSPHYFLPHHCVMKPTSSSTKLRVVCDAAAKTSSGKSLNDILMVGPVIQPDLFSIALRFRRHKFVMTADITKMYHQVRLDESDRRFHYILWRNCENEIAIYRLCTVTFGTACASFLSTRALKQLSIDEGEKFPAAAKAIISEFYVDDLITGCDSLDQLKELKSELISLLGSGGFILKKWCANSLEIMEEVPENDREQCFKIKGSEVIKTLGTFWSPVEDMFHYEITPLLSTCITKRTVLSDIAHLFDPLGLINPVIVLAKIFMQQLWRLKLTWDEALPQEFYHSWLKFRKNLGELNNMHIRRRVFFGHPANYQLHAFSDSSEDAFGTCVYIRSVDDNGTVRTNLLCGKSKVAPVRKVTLPRLELCAAVMMVQLVQRLKEIFGSILHHITYWTDSSIVLNWISEESCNFQTFVANRVSIIHQHSSVSQWRHISSELNPADVISRGSYPSALIKNEMWFSGPSFLKLEESTWNSSNVILNVDDAQLERKRTKTIFKICIEPDLIENIKYHNNFESLIRVVAYIFRYRHNGIKKNINTFGPLTVEELNKSLKGLVKYVQLVSFQTEIETLSKGYQLSSRCHIKSLAPFLDSDGILRVGDHAFTTILVRHLHEKNFHSGPQALLSIVRDKFWPIHGKIVARKVVHKCVRCTRARPSRNLQVMGDLPHQRVHQSRPFNIVGVDFCGPFSIHFRRRGTSPMKAYVAVFVCFVTRAVHLELVEDLTTHSFLAALKRFIGRRGLCSVIYSDNATNFIGARNQLHELYKMFMQNENREEIIKTCAADGIEWKTIPPRSPHFGGLWEAAVKSCKFHMKRTLQNSSLTYPELNTILIQIESILNSRPITPLSQNPNDIQALTPGHFLIGTPLTAAVEPQLHNCNVNTLTRYQQLQWYFQQFWLRWSREYLQGLQIRAKWNENLPPLKWRLGRVVQVHPGKDNVVRVVTLKTSTGEVQRAVTRIRRLPIEEPESIQGGENVET
ncbi:uncharacterized protein LOC129950600 [Eupeodes corollae]|uniref:uncharacterized protein LOC129950600 n=1 Tax=Eupeodes corollae TaxID=290404 RepID=UPI0024915854|nr:uncharacterized protein LOC129950600 [Eupeodes corollae]